MVQRDIHSAKAVYYSANYTRETNKVGWCTWDVHSAKALYYSANCIAASSEVDLSWLEGGQTGCCSPSTVNFNPFTSFTPMPLKLVPRCNLSISSGTTVAKKFLLNFLIHQSRRKCVIVASAMRAEQGPCEPIKGCIPEIREQ